MDSNTTIAGPSTNLATISEPDAAQIRKRQRQASCNGNADEEEPRKRTRQSTRRKPRSNLEAPMPWIESDIVGVTNPRAVRTRRHSRKWLEAHHDGADGAAVPEEGPVQSHRPPPQPNDGLDQHGPGSPEAVIQSMKARITELEKERDDYHDSFRKQAVTSGEQGQQLLLLRTRLETAFAESKEQYSRQLSHRDGQIKQLQKEIEQLRAPHSERKNDQELLTAQNISLSKAIDKSTKVKERLMDEACTLSAQGVQVESRKELAVKDLDGSMGSVEEQNSRLRKAEPGMDQSDSSRQCEKMVASAVERENKDWVTRFDFHRRAAKAKLEKATASLLQENKALNEKVSIAENKILQLRDDNQQLNAELVAKRDLQNQIDVVITTLTKTKDDGARKENVLNERIAILEAEKLQDEVAAKRNLQDQISILKTSLVKAKEDGDRKKKELDEKVFMLQAHLSRLQHVDCAKRQLEIEKIQQTQEITALQASIADLKVKLEKRGKEKEEVQSLLCGADAKIDLLTKKAETTAKSSRTAFQEAEAKHDKELSDLRATFDSLSEAMNTAAKSSENALQEEKAKHGEERRILEDEIKKLRVSHDKAAAVVLKRAKEAKQLEAEVDTLRLALRAKEKEGTELQNQLRDEIHDLGVKAELLTAAKHDLQTALQVEETKYAEHIGKLEAATKILKLALEAKEQENTRLQSEFQELNVKIELLTTANRNYEGALQKERAKYAEDTEILKAEVDKLSFALDDTETLKTGVDKLSFALNAETGETVWLQTHVRNLEANIKSITTASHDEAAVRLQEREKHVKDIETLETTARSLSLALELKGQEETTLQNQLREAKDRIMAITATSLNRDAILDEQKAYIDALDKELSELRHKASLEQVRTEAFSAARERIIELEAETRRLEGELIGAGQVRLEIQDASVWRISELETQMRRLEEQSEKQAKAIREAQEGNQEALLVKADNFELRRTVDDLRQRLQQLETTSSPEREYHQRAERFLDHVRSQLSRTIEDVRVQDTDEEEKAKRATMEGLQIMLTLKLNSIEAELSWYRQRYDEGFTRRKALQAENRVMRQYFCVP